MHDFVSAIKSGSVLRLTHLTDMTVSEALFPMVDTRGHLLAQPEQKFWLALAKTLAPGEVAAFAGQDRAPFVSLIYPVSTEGENEHVLGETRTG